MVSKIRLWVRKAKSKMPIAQMLNFLNKYKGDITTILSFLVALVVALYSRLITDVNVSGQWWCKRLPYVGSFNRAMDGLKKMDVYLSVSESAYHELGYLYKGEIGYNEIFQIIKKKYQLSNETPDVIIYEEIEQSNDYTPITGDVTVFSNLKIKTGNNKAKTIITKASRKNYIYKPDYKEIINELNVLIKHELDIKIADLWACLAIILFFIGIALVFVK